MGRVWHWSQPPGGGISLHAENIAHPHKKEKNITNDVIGILLSMGSPFWGVLLGRNMITKSIIA
jgi:hypothetical protein